MKKIFAHILVLMLICACSTYDINEHHASIADSNHEIKRVAVVDFDFSMSEKGKIDRGKIVRPMNAGSIVADIFTEHLLGTGLYRVVERRQIERALNALNIDRTRLFDASSLGKLQKTLNVDGLIVGVVMEYGDWRSRINWGGVAVFTARLVDIDTGLVIWSTSANLSIAMTNSGAVAHAASQEALRELSAKLGR